MLELVELSLTKNFPEVFGNIHKCNTNVCYTVQWTSEHINTSPEIKFVRCFTSETVLGEHRVD